MKFINKLCLTFSLILFLIALSACHYKGTIDLSADSSRWQQVADLPGITFSFPPELVYRLDSGNAYFKLKESKSDSTLLIIYYQGLKECENGQKIGECDSSDPNDPRKVTRSPEYVLARRLSSLRGITNHGDRPFSERGEVEVGNVRGFRFISNQLGKGTDTPDFIIFKGSQGVFTISTDEKKVGSDFLEAFLKTFKVE